MNAATFLLPLVGQYKTDLITLELAMNDVRTLAARIASLDPTEASASSARITFANEVTKDIADRRAGLELLCELLEIAENVETAGADLVERVADLEQRAAAVFGATTDATGP